MIDLQAGVRGFVIAGDPRFLEPSERARRLLPGQLRRVRLAAAEDPRQRALADRIDRRIRSYIEDYTVPLVARARRDREAATRVVARGEGKRRVDRLRYDFALLSSRERASATVRERRAQAQADRAVALGLGGLGACVLLILVYALYLARSITEPVRAVAKTIRRLSGGDRGARVEETGPSELRALASSFNSMAAAIEGGRRELEGQNIELEAQQVSLQHALGELAERKRRIEASQAFLERLGEHADVAPLGRTILDGLCEFAGAEIGTLFSVEGERDRTLFPLAARSLVDDAGTLSGDLAPRRRALAEARSVQLPSSGAKPSLRSSDGRAALRELHLPLRLGDRPVAVLSLGRLEDRSFTRGELTAIEHLVDQAASAATGPRAARRDDAPPRRLRGDARHPPQRRDERHPGDPADSARAGGRCARGFNAGADDYIKKPFSPQELRARVQAVLGRR